MLENRARYVLVGLEKPDEDSWRRRPLIEKIVRDSRGWIDVIVMLVNGTRVAFSGGDGVKPEQVADAASSIAQATLAVMELFGSRKFDEMGLQVDGGRYLVIRGYKDCYIAALTKPNPNLGLVKQAFERNLASNRPLRKVVHVGSLVESIIYRLHKPAQHEL